MDGNEEHEWMNNITSYAIAMERQASLGDNWVLPYGLSARFTVADQRWFLDRCADVGVKVMVPLANTVGSKVRNLDPLIHDAAWLDWVRGNVSVLANHSALLGWYICDDCCPFAPNSGPIGNVSEQAILYNMLKAADPIHLVIGAIQCSDAWMWTDVPSYLPPTGLNETIYAVIPAGAQPRLQLSLDLILCKLSCNCINSFFRMKQQNAHHRSHYCTLTAADCDKHNVAIDNRGELRRHTQRWATSHGTLRRFTCRHCLGGGRKRDDSSGRLV
jgi:hypothetical protein